jgi:hypothetical protein
MTKQQSVFIDLDEVTATYESDLVDKLRNFGVGGELFETWVPDPDPIKSIVNLVDSAWNIGLLSTLKIRVSKKTLDSGRLINLSKEFSGRLLINVVEEETCRLLTIAGFDRGVGDSRRQGKDGLMGFKKSPAPKTEQLRVPASGPKKVITSSLEESQEPRRNELYDLPNWEPRVSYDLDGDVSGSATVAVEENACGLKLRVDVSDHVIKQAVCYEKTSDGMLPMLDRFCTLIEGRPIQDASDHGISRLECEVRAGQPPPVPGIVIPASVDDRFGQAESLIRQALEKYRNLTGYQGTINTFDQSPSKEWSDLSKHDQIRKIKALLAPYIEGLGFSRDDFEVIDIEYGLRILIRFSGLLADSLTDKQPIIMCGEQILIENLEPRLEVFLEPVEDQSKLRRLTPERQHNPR